MKEIRKGKKIFVLTLVIFSIVFAIFIPAVVSRTNVLIKNKPINNKIEKDNKINFLQYYKNTFKNFMFNRLITNGLVNSYINTYCNGIEKSTEISYFTKIAIDVDNNPDTGENGDDIKVNYYLSPSFEFNSDFVISITFTLIIYTLDDSIKNSDFKASLSIGANKVVLGYRSPIEAGNEVPGYITLSFKISFFLFQRTHGFTLYMEPLYNNGNENKKIELFAELNSDKSNNSISIHFDPAVVTEMSIISSKKQGEWNYDFSRTSSEESKVTSTLTNDENGEINEITVSIDKLPRDLEFLLGLTPLTEGGGQFLYESSQMYDIELLIQSDELGSCKYSIIKNTPRRIFAEWIPTLSNGEYHLEINSEGTDFILKDKIDYPNINLEVNSLKTINIDSFWNLTNPGDFTVYKDNDINIGLCFQIGEWIAQLSAQPNAIYVSTNWLIATTGYLTIDTNWESFSTMDLLVKGPNMGLDTIGEGYKAQDFKINWTLWPPQEWDLTIHGQIEWISVSIDIYLFNEWYHLWPWS